MSIIINDNQQKRFNLDSHGDEKGIFHKRFTPNVKKLGETSSRIKDLLSAKRISNNNNEKFSQKISVIIMEINQPWRSYKGEFASCRRPAVSNSSVIFYK